MTIPTSGAVSLADIRAEFGGGTTTPLHSYVRGGSYVPNTPGNSGVPTSPPITIDDLRGASAYVAMTGSLPSLFGTSRTFDINKVLGTTTASVSGGNPSKSYAFAKYSGNTGHFGISSSGATCTITIPGTPGAGVYEMQLRCIVTDGTGSLTLYATVRDTRT